MKRSEVIKCIENTIDNISEEYCLIIEEPRDLLAEQILKDLIELGIKPKQYINPKAVEDPEIDTNSKWGYVQYIDKYPEHRMRNGVRPYEYYIEGWEPEDET